MNEFSRQLIHLSGVLFVILGQLIGPLIVVYFILAAFFFFIYSQYIMMEQKRVSRIISTMEEKLRGLALGFERKDVARPLMGAFWFYFGCGIAFLLFPIGIASAACLMLAIGDSFSTMIGHKYGKHKILGKKSVEGSIAFYITALIPAVILLPLIPAIIGALVAVLVELLPDIKAFRTLKKKQIIDDNWLIPILSGLVIYLILLI
ncbi:MAG: hypothetical protein ABIJ92_01350 [Candidatus Aenigmatarchaeota archaeon]